MTALRKKTGIDEGFLPSRRLPVYVLTELDYYFFKVGSGHERVYDMLQLRQEEGRQADA